MSNFEISHSREGPQDEAVEVLGLKGQLDAHTFGTLQNTLETLVGKEQPRVILNCQELSYISSAGLGVLKKMTREFRERQGDIRLASLSSKINNVMDLLGFSQVIRVFPDLEEAVESYQEPPASDA